MKHKPTKTEKKNIDFLYLFNVQKGLIKIIHIKEDQADVFKVAENIYFYKKLISKSVDICYGFFYLFPDLRLFLWLSVSLSQGL